jgi:hypothetical protein
MPVVTASQKRPKNDNFGFSVSQAIKKETRKTEKTGWVLDFGFSVSHTHLSVGNRKTQTGAFWKQKTPHGRRRKMAKNGELTQRQRRMIAELLAQPNIGAACEAAGVGRTTLARWLRTPEFKQAMAEAQSDHLAATTRTLLAGQSAALKTLGDLLDAANPPGVRRQAAVDWLGLSQKFLELHDLVERISRLEAAQDGD